MSWLPPSSLVGAPSPADLFNQGKSKAWNLDQKDSSGPISSASVNPYLKPIAVAELAAEAAAVEAMALADHAAASNDGYELAFSKIQTAANRWRDVRQLALALEAKTEPSMTTTDLATAKLAVPGILQTVSKALAALVQATEMLRADQAQNRPDLAPAKALDENGSDGMGWGALAIAGGIVYLLYKAVF